MSEQYTSDLPLPGGVEQYYDTLVTLLRRVADSPMSQQQVAETITEVCPNASRSTAIGMYISLITRMGLWSAKDDVFKLTPEAHNLLEKDESDPAGARWMILSLKLRDVAGYDEILRALSDGALSFDAMDTRLKAHLNVSWKSKNQTMFRLNWLRSLGYVARAGHDYLLTDAGREVLSNGKLTQETTRPGGNPQTTPSPSPSPSQIATCHTAESIAIADDIQQAATCGGDGTELENATARAFEFLGFSVQLISGSGNPDIAATALMGQCTYRVLIDTKSRSSGVVNQNDVNFNALNEHKAKFDADFMVVLASDFAGGNLEKWACEQKVRFIRVEELRQIMLAHSEAAIPLDRLRELFIGGGTTDEATLSAILTDAESSSQMMTLCRQVYDAVLAHQDQEAALNEHSLFYLLSSAHSIDSIRAAIALLQSSLLAALGRTDGGSLICRLSPATLAKRLDQIRDVIGGASEQPDHAT